MWDSLPFGKLSSLCSVFPFYEDTAVYVNPPASVCFPFEGLVPKHHCFYLITNLVCAHTCPHKYAWRGLQEDVGWPTCSPHYWESLKQGLSLNLKLACHCGVTLVASKPQLFPVSNFNSNSASDQNLLSYTGVFYLAAKDPYLGPHACTASVYTH